MSTDIRTASLVDTLAGLVAEDEDALALAAAIDPEIQAVAELAEQCAFLSRIEDLTHEQADKVAAWFSLTKLEGWGLADLARKRSVMAEMVDVYRRRGTPWAWDRITTILETPTTWDDGETEWDDGETIWDDRAGMYSLTEWWEQDPTDPPHTYRVDALIEHRGLTVAEIRHLQEVLDAYVPSREELLELSETTPLESALVCAGAPSVGLDLEIL